MIHTKKIRDVVIRVVVSHLAALAAAIGFLTLAQTSAGAAVEASADAHPLPASGVHPRLFFGPDGLAALRQRLLASEHGAYAQQLMAGAYAGMKGRLEAFAALDLTHPDPATIAEWFKPDENRNISWGLIAVDAVVRDDRARQELMAKVITNHARLILASRALRSGGALTGATGANFGKRLDVWATSDFDMNTSWLLGAAGFPICYDLLFNAMSPEQRATVRAALAAATAGRRSFGADMPKGRAFSNWYGYHGDLAVMLASIEGEEGYDAEAYRRFTALMTNYFEVSFSADGACHEDAYGPNLGLRAGSLALLVMARRGQDLLHTERYRNFVRWYAQELEPSPQGHFVGGASGTGLPYIASAIVARHVLPDDPAAAYVYRYLVGSDYRRSLTSQCYLDFALFGSDLGGDAKAPADFASTGLPLAAFYPERGKLIARSAASADALALHFDARPDAFGIGHDTVDRGTFELSALGRPWAVHPAFRDTQDSRDFSLVHIDGKAEGWKAPSVKFVWHGEAASAAGGSADLKYAYDWQWTPPWPEKGQTFPAPWEHELSDPRTLGWPGDPDWLPHKLFGEEGIGHIGSYMWRRPYNPVVKAFRSALLVRGPHPYSVIADDIRKDDAAHEYAWHLQLAADVVEERHAGNDVILADPATSARLLVRVLAADGFQNATLESYQIAPKQIAAKRLIVLAKSIEPGFRILLLPFTAGEALPQTTWDAANARAKLGWSDQDDEVDLAIGAEGRAHPLVRRGAAQLLAAP